MTDELRIIKLTESERERERAGDVSTLTTREPQSQQANTTTHDPIVLMPLTEFLERTVRL